MEQLTVDKKAIDNSNMGFQFLLKTRTIMIGDAIDQKVAEKVITQILFLESQDAKKNIYLYINSPGGEVTSGMAIYDIMQFTTCPIVTIVVGLAASMGSLLAIGGSSGKCFAAPNSRFMIHQPLINRVIAKASDLEITAKEIEKTKQNIAEFYAKKTKKKVGKILEDMDKDLWFSAQEALKYKLIDKIITTRQELLQNSK